MSTFLMVWEVVLSIVGVYVLYLLIRDIINIVSKKTLMRFSSGEFIGECIFVYIVLGIVIWIHTGYPYAFIYIVWIIDYFKSSYVWSL